MAHDALWHMWNSSILMGHTCCDRKMFPLSQLASSFSKWKSHRCAPEVKFGYCCSMAIGLNETTRQNPSASPCCHKSCTKTWANPKHFGGRGNIYIYICIHICFEHIFLTHKITGTCGFDSFGGIWICSMISHQDVWLQSTWGKIWLNS